jgi:hypothetical protein
MRESQSQTPRYYAPAVENFTKKVEFASRKIQHPKSD